MDRFPSTGSRALLAIVVGLAAGCGGRGQSGASSAPPVASAATAAAAPTAAEPSAAEPSAAAEPAPAPLIAGTWSDTAAFRFRVTGLRRCRTQPSARAAARRDATGAAAVPAGADGSVRLAFAVEVEAVHDLFVSPRDLVLDHAGVLYPSDSDLGRTLGCGRLLAPQSLHGGQHASGAVVFGLPEAEARDAVLVFAPTRWGGAPRVALAMPDCLDACGRPGQGPRQLDEAKGQAKVSGPAG